MNLDLSIKLSEDLLHGVPEDLSLFKPVLIAQKALLNFHFNEIQVLEIRDEILVIFNNWKLKYGKSKSFGGLLSSEAESEIDCIDQEPWQCAGYGIDSVIDLYEKLLYEKYEPAIRVSEKYLPVQIYAVLVLTVALQPISSTVFFSDPALRNRLAAFKGSTEILALTPVIQDLTGLLESYGKYLAPKIYEQAKKSFASSGGTSTAEKFRVLKDFLIDKFNEGKYSSMSKGADAITPIVVDFDRKNRGLIQAQRPRDTIYKWLRDANQENKLYKKFK